MGHGPDKQCGAWVCGLVHGVCGCSLTRRQGITPTTTVTPTFMLAPTTVATNYSLTHTQKSGMCAQAAARHTAHSGELCFFFSRWIQDRIQSGLWETDSGLIRL